MDPSAEPSSQVHQADSAASGRPYKLLMTLPDLRRDRPKSPLGNLRVNWRRRQSESRVSIERFKRLLAAKPLWSIAATLLGLLAVSWTALQFGSSHELPSSHSPEPSPPVQGQAKADLAQDDAGSTVPEGYETAANTQIALRDDAGPSLFSLRPSRLAGTIESLEVEGAP